MRGKRAACREGLFVPYALLLGLSLFYGFAFEEFYSDLPNRPGGVRTFPLLSFAGAALYLVEPHFALAFVAGLAAIGLWLYAYVRQSLQVKDSRIEAHFIVPAAILIAYALGPIALTQPAWLSVGLIVACVLLIAAREPLHALVARVPESEIWTLGQFLLLVGVVLPLLYNAPAIPYTHITPFKVWLAVVAVSTLSYVSYLLQRYVFPSGGILIAAVLGGLYSSTATTVVLAREASQEGFSPEISAGIVAASAMMYLRIVIVCAIFNAGLARVLLLPLAALGVLAGIAAYVLSRRSGKTLGTHLPARNPLQIGTALLFAVLLVAISLLSNWVVANMGRDGVLALAAVVGFTDIDPFVLSIAQGGAAVAGVAVSAAAIVIATSSNNVLKALYAVLFSRPRTSYLASTILVALALIGVGIAALVARP